MPKKIYNSNQAPKPIGPYSQAVAAGGLLFLSGQTPIDPETGEVVEGDIEAQTERAILNLLAVLKEARVSPDNVVKTTVYLADMKDFPRMNEVYARHFKGEPPARTTIQAAGLPRNVQVEIDLIAAF
ncbi:MAG: RidA family protein [Vicinamibacteria bacterium]|nr:RidA family protein [Vicinamibacteria bacterium]